MYHNNNDNKIIVDLCNCKATGQSLLMAIFSLINSLLLFLDSAKAK